MTYIIRATRTYYGPRTITTTVQGERGDATFATREAALAKVEELDAAPYHQDVNEYGRPIYSVRKLEG